MSEQNTPQNDELNVEELEEVAGGVVPAEDTDINENCGNNCHC